MYASNSHSCTHLILALGIVREPTVWVFITSEYHGIHDIGLPSTTNTHACITNKHCFTKVLSQYRMYDQSNRECAHTLLILTLIRRCL